MTEWAVLAAAPQLQLDARNRAEMTFTVTNPGAAPDRAVFLVEPADGVPRSWFTVEEPQRLVPPGGSVSYLVVLTVPPNTQPGSYALQGCVYSANTAPEESSRRSGRVTFEVRPAEQPKRPWWPYAVAAGLVLVVLAVAGWLVFKPSTAPKPPTPLASNASVTYEMEKLIPSVSVAGISKDFVQPQSDCCGVTFSNHAQLFFTAQNAGESMTVSFTVPATGLYTFSSIRTKSFDYGNTVYLIDDHQVGNVFYGYTGPRPAVTAWLTEGDVRLTAGTHRLTLSITGRSAEATNFYAGVDAIRFVQTAP
jgi:hypothetical protein